MTILELSLLLLVISLSLARSDRCSVLAAVS